MSSIASIVDLLHPTPSGIGIITADQIWVLFDREIDETTLAGGNFFVTGPDFDSFLGPDLQLFLEAESIGSETEILESPGFHGIVQGTISFERFDLDSLSVISGLDVVGSGFLHRTKVILTPSIRLQASTEYTVYLSGDEDSTDSLQTGISSRTVFDTVTSGDNTGAGVVTFDGGYLGSSNSDTYRVQVTISGDVNTSRFTFFKDSDPSSVFGPFKTKRNGVLLSDGVSVSFTEGLYRVDDQFSVVVKARNTWTDNLSWTFKTGTGSIVTVPTTAATSVLGDPAPVATTSSSSTALSVSSTSPASYDTNLLPSSLSEITVTFNQDIDPTSITQSGIIVFSESVDGDPGVPSDGAIPKILTVSGSKLTIKIA